LVAVVRGGGATLYDLPDGEAMGQLPTGTALTAWGRNSDGTWLVVTATTGAAGWIQASTVVVFNVDGLPILDGTQPAPVGQGAGMADMGGTPVPMPEGTDAMPAAQPTAPAAATPAALGDGEITATVTLTDSRLNIRSGPGTGFGVVAKAEGGDVFQVTGRNRAATWIEVALTEESGFGWVAAEFIELSRPILGIPVSERAAGEAPITSTERQPATVQPVAQQPVAQQPAVAAGRAVDGLSGRLVFQASNGGTIYVYELATGDVRELTGGFDPAISPDGSTVAFTRQGGDQGLYLIGIDGRNERLIFSGGERLRAPTWSPDGKWLAFIRVAGSFNCRDVGFGICLPNNPFLGDFPLDSRAEFGLSRVDFNGENFRDLNALTSAQAPDWHTDGIVYQVATGLEVTQDLADGQTEPLVQSPFYRDPAWQPGGNRIIFQSKEGSHWEIFTIDRDGTGLAALTRPQSVLVDEMPSNVAPAWSPDGQWIVFASTRNDQNSAGEWRLWVMDSAGGNQRPLPLDVPIDYSFSNEQLVSWGP
jgi:Tol biopolymer transport system component